MNGTTLRDELGWCLRRVPAKVNGASIQMAAAYKKWAATAVKVMANTRASDLQIKQMIQQHKGFQ